MAHQTPPPYYIRASVDTTPRPGQRVSVYIRGKPSKTVHDCGVVRFRGKVHFAAGEWCGVELDSEQQWGRNDGSVEGVRYFECAPRQGVFVKAHRCTAANAADSDCVASSTQQLTDESLRRRGSTTPSSGATSRHSTPGFSPFETILSFSPPDSSRSGAYSDADARFEALLAEYSNSGSPALSTELEPWKEHRIFRGEDLGESMELFERLGRALAAKSHAQSMQAKRIATDSSVRSSVG